MRLPTPLPGLPTGAPDRRPGWLRARRSRKPASSDAIVVGATDDVKVARQRLARGEGSRGRLGRPGGAGHGRR